MTGGNCDVNKCVACRFWLWFEGEQSYRCSIKGCYENHKFIAFDPSNPKHYEPIQTKSQHAN